MPDPNYDPQKAHEYYLRTRELKGRRHGSGKPPTPHIQRRINGSDQQKVAQIQAKLSRLNALLQKKLAESHSSGSGSKQKSAVQKAKDRQNSKDYYNKHKQKINNDRKKSSGGGGSSGGSFESMSVDELKTAIRRTVVQLKAAIAQARGG